MELPRSIKNWEKNVDFRGGLVEKKVERLWKFRYGKNRLEIQGGQLKKWPYRIHQRRKFLLQATKYFHYLFVQLKRDNLQLNMFLVFRNYVMDINSLQITNNVFSKKNCIVWIINKLISYLIQGNQAAVPLG